MGEKKMEGAVFAGALDWPVCTLDVSSPALPCPGPISTAIPLAGCWDVLCCHGTAFPASSTEEVQSLPAIPGQTAQTIIHLYILLNWKEE